MLPVLTISGAVIGLVGLRLLVPRIGIVGAAWASLASNVAVIFAAYPLSQRSLRMVYDRRKLGMAAAAGIGTVLASYLLASRVDGLVKTFLLNLVLATAYAGLLARVVGLSLSRVRLMLSTLRVTES
jgi:O-antigen/teichoic acid export membrane protein